MAAKAPKSVREDDYGLICSRLLNGGFRMDAMDIMKAGDERYPTSAKMKETRDAVIEATDAGPARRSCRSSRRWVTRAGASNLQARHLDPHAICETPMRNLSLILLLLVAACGGSSADPSPGSSAEIRAKTGEGFAALGKGDAKTALSKFDAALVGLDSTNPEYLRASLGRCEALAKTDGEAAKKAFLELVAKVPAAIG